MALTVSMSQIDAIASAGRPTKLQVNVTNTSASSVTLNDLAINETTDSNAVIAQPNYLTPNVALGVGNPTIGAGATVSYPFAVVFQSPNGAGESPAAYPSPAGVFVGQPPTESCKLLATATASDGSVGQATAVAWPLSSIAPFPPVATGTLQLQFSSGFNLIGLCVGL